MSKVYSDYDHTHVVVHHPKAGKDDKWDHEGWRSTFPIVLHTGKQVWVMGSYSHEGHPEVKRVGDSRDAGYDVHGNCILSVPADWCHYFTETEAQAIEQMIDADDRLLSYAR
jgi:hypothetical protein